MKDLHRLAGMCAFALIIFISTLPVQADAPPPNGYRIYPEIVTLNHQQDWQQLILLEYSQGQAVRDLTRSIRLRSDDEHVAVVDERGVVHPRGIGRASVHAEIDGRDVSVSIHVANYEKPLWSFTNDIQPMFTKIGCNTGACHGSEAGKGGLDLSLRGYDHFNDYNAMVRQANGRRVLLADPEQSLILQKPSGKIPHGGGRLIRDDSFEYQTIKAWLDQGAAPPQPDDKKVASIQVFPRMAQLTTGEQQQLIVTAFYDDGSTKDVTRWAKYDTSNDSVATVSRDGLAEMQGSGTAALTVWYADNVAYSSIAVPYPDELDEAIFAQAERQNYIDDKILDQLQALNIAPSELSSDAEFVRRAYLDAIGVLPTPRETIQFVMDDSPNKRAKLIDRLLEREEYVDQWAYKWSDLLMVSTANPGTSSREAVMAYYRFIRESVEENKGWDQFAREILIARGSTIENGAANYFALRKETTELTETTSQVFLGLAITCARCHNHPMEKWTQDDYFGMANLFARVTLKDGDRSGETFVFNGSSGEVLHPVYNKPMPPRPLDGDPIPANYQGDRREFLADWLASDQNPYFARNLINRVWAHFMGRGIVDPEDDLRLTNPPVNEPLLAALEEDFVSSGYDVKHLIRTIMNSAAYQRSSKPRLGNERDEEHFARYYPKRLPAEVILDAYSQITGVPTQFSGYPEGWRAQQLPDSNVLSQFLDVFGRPDRRETCACDRDPTPTLSQALHIANGTTLNEKLMEEKNIVSRFLQENKSLREIVFDLYLAALSRPPTYEEEDAILTAFGGDEGWRAESEEERRNNLEDLVWALLSGKQFMFNH